MKAIFILSFFHSFIFLASCSEDSEEAGEWDNWQERNEAKTAEWAASSVYTKYKNFTKDQSTAGKSSDYIYVKVLESGSATESPLYMDSVRVAYRLRYIPTATYAEGYLVSQTFVGDFDWKTMGVTDLQLNSNLIDGFNTALMNMHVGDYWQVNIPYEIAYGNPASRSDIRDASNLVYEIALVDFWHPGETRPAFKARTR